MKRKKDRLRYGHKTILSRNPPAWTQMPDALSLLARDNMPKELMPRRDAEVVKPKVVTVDGYLVAWGKRMGHEVSRELVAKALRQYLKTLERTRRTKRRNRSTEEGRERIREQNAASRRLRREDGHADAES